MLSANLPLLKQNLNDLLSVPPLKEGVVYKAAYDAYYNVIKTDIDTNNSDPDLAPIVASSAAQCEQKMIDDAKQFATDFCNGLKSGGFMDSIADAINSHIQSAQIDITVPAIPPTITSPTGPCTGSLIISKSIGAQIVIS